jgi:SPP1 gp7 family putative phage head morphogenesis protein
MTANATAALVVALERAGVASRPRMVPRELQPDFIEAAYAKDLIALIAEWRTEFAIDMPSLVRLDDLPESARARSAITRMRDVAYRQASRVQDRASRAGRDAVDHQSKQLQRQLKAGLGVEIPTRDERVPTLVERFVERNVADVQALSDKTANDIQRLVLDAFERGARPEELAAEIQAKFDIAETRARLIAGNQLSRLSSQVRRDRHAEIGISMFKWVTRNDGRVRSAHEVKHNRIFPYKGSRAPSFFPGEEINCRCLAVPIVDDIKSKARALAGKGRTRR